jgi:DNA-binding Lrp family transcriptional regulator
MVRAFIMVKTSAGNSAELREAIAGTAGVVAVHVVAGQYDIIAEARGEEVYEVIHSVATSVRDLDGVVDTRTYMCLE